MEKEVTTESLTLKICEALNKELAVRIQEILKANPLPKKLELCKHVPHEEGAEPYFTIEIDGKNCFPQVPLNTIKTLEQAQQNYDMVKNFKKPVREVVLMEELSNA